MQNFQQIHDAAHAAGMAALDASTPTPMVVSDNRSGQKWFVADGVCGFAWVKFAGNTAWARWAKSMKLASKAYPNGLMIWVGYGNQSMTKKEAYAAAYAQVLRDNGITAYSQSRMD